MRLALCNQKKGGLCMKKFIKYVFSLLIFCNFVSVSAMELPETQNVFITSTIADIQNLATDLSRGSEFEYQLVAMPVLVQKCLAVLGLNENNTPLDIRYHYELLQNKIPLNSPLHNVITKAYNQLIFMLSVIDYYKEEIDQLVSMSFDKVQAIELEDKDKSKHYQFLRNKNRLINNVIHKLQEKQRQYVVTNQSGLPVAIQVLLNLPANASHQQIEERYYNYIANNSLDRLIALQKMNNISREDLKKKLDEVSRVKEAYAAYVRQKK